MTIPRLNVDAIEQDQRFLDLCVKSGNKFLAYGYWIAAVRLAQRYWIPEKKLIPKIAWVDTCLPQILIEVRLVEERDDGYYVRGMEDYFSWWFEARDQCSAAGRKSAAARKLKYGSSQPPNGRQNGPKLTRCSPREIQQGSFDLLLCDKDRTSFDEKSNGSSIRDRTEMERNRTESNPLILSARSSAPSGSDPVPDLLDPPREKKSRTKGGTPSAPPPPEGSGSLRKSGKSGRGKNGVGKYDGMATAAVVRAYVDVWRARYGADGRPDLSKAVIGQIERFAAEHPGQRGINLVQVYLQMTDPWFATKCHDFNTLMGNITKVSAAMASGKQKPGESSWEELEQQEKEKQNGTNDVQRTDESTQTGLRQGRQTESLPAGDRVDLLEDFSAPF